MHMKSIKVEAYFDSWCNIYLHSLKLTSKKIQLTKNCSSPLTDELCYN